MDESFRFTSVWDCNLFICFSCIDLELAINDNSLFVFMLTVEYSLIKQIFFFFLSSGNDRKLLFRIKLLAIC